jgi:Ca2+-binding EF-hand superfamily protein
MKPIKILGLLALSLCLMSPPVEAAGKGDAGKKKKEEREKKRAENEKNRKAVEDYMTPLDKNKDGSLTFDEFIEAETDKAAGKTKFDRYNKNGDRYLTRAEIEDMLGIK